jgi:hypothetical protein
MSPKTARKYRDSEQLPSQVQRPPRNYRTRQDPLSEYWSEIEELLQQDCQLKPYAILDWLKQKYNSDDAEPRVTNSIRRSLERRVQHWKLQHGVEQEVKFPQQHHPGDVLAFDFVVLNSLKVTVAGKAFDHMLFHAVLTYSNWEYVHLCHSESFEALSTGLQDALHMAGGVPQRVRSDSLSAAVNNLSSDKEFAGQYSDLLAHYGLTGHRINARKPHENGDVESSHGHVKDALDQLLRLRGSRDFVSVDEYMAFVRGCISRRNADRHKRFIQEVPLLAALPAQRRPTCSSIQLTVKSDSIIRVKRNAYSVSSKYIGLQLEVRIHQDRLELWYRNECLEQMPRQFGYGKEFVDFRHVIDSLIRKPGAFLNYKYVNHLYPTTRFRMAYDQLVQNTTEKSAVKQYLEILHAAKQEGLDLVDDTLRWFMSEGKAITAVDVLEVVRSQQQLPCPTEVHVDVPDLSDFDSLLEHKDVYHEQASYPLDSQASDDQSEASGGGLAAYDRHIETPGAAEGVTTSDLPGESGSDCLSSSPRRLDSHSVPGGTGRAGMPSEEPKSHSAVDAQCQFIGWEDVGSVQLVSAAASSQTAIRDTAHGRLFEPPGQCVDFWEAGLRQDDAAFCAGRPVSQARQVGLLYDLPDAGAGVATRQTRSAAGAIDQEARQVRGLDHRRSGLCSAEPRGNGSTIHASRGTLRARQCAAQFEFAVFEMGADLQGSNDDCSGHRSPDSSRCNHRAKYSQLPTRAGREEQGQNENFTAKNIDEPRRFPVPSNCR